MISKNVKVEVALREEDRPIAFLVQMASQFESKILFETGNKQVNVKSMMGMMSLGLDLDRSFRGFNSRRLTESMKKQSARLNIILQRSIDTHICAFIMK